QSLVIYASSSRSRLCSPAGAERRRPRQQRRDDCVALKAGELRIKPPVSRLRCWDYVLVFASSSAQAFATPELGVFSPREVAHPPASINSRCFHDSIFVNSASFTAEFACCMNLATQEGAGAPITAAFLRSAAFRCAWLVAAQ